MAMNSHSSDVSILKVDLQDLMKQICLKEMELFKAIPKEEINSFYWMKSSKKHKCPHLLSSNKQFNKLNFWVQKEILHHANTPKGVKVLSKFIKLSRFLLDKNNFQSAYAVKAALDSTPIFRLEQLWSGISKKNIKVWEGIRLVFSLENNLQNLRNAIATSKPPLIPYLGVYLSDLTGLDAAHPKVAGVESAIRISSMSKIFILINHYQKFNYDFKPHRGIQDYIQSMEYIEEFEHYMSDSYFDMSRELEPSCCLTASDSSHSSNVDLKAESYSPNVNSRASYRVISEDERREQTIIQPDSPTLTNNRHSHRNGKAIKNIIDDSEFYDENVSDIIEYRKQLHHTKSIQSQTSSCSNKYSINSNQNLSNNYQSGRKSDIETKSYTQYNDPDILTKNVNSKPVLTGLVKRKIKSKNSVSMSGYQRVLARLYLDQLDCYINFYTSKINKPKNLDDFREEYNARISILEANLRFEPLINCPKLYIEMPHDTYVIQSIDDSHCSWPPLDKWWAVIEESVNAANTSKAAVFEPQCNLINLDYDSTRL